MSDTEKKSGDEPVKNDKRPTPPAGPHARRDLTNYDATPGAGTLSGPEEDDDHESVSS